MTERNSVILSSFVTALVCGLSFTIFLLSNVFGSLLLKARTDGNYETLIEIKKAALANKNTTSLAFPDGTNPDGSQAYTKLYVEILEPRSTVPDTSVNASTTQSGVSIE